MLFICLWNPPSVGLIELRVCSDSWRILPTNVLGGGKGIMSGSGKTWHCQFLFPVGKLSFISSRDFVVELVL